jgi:hypothetical protein
MPIFKKKDLTELVGGDSGSSGGDKVTNSDSEIETGPVQKSFNDKSDYERGQSTTSDRVFQRYRQNIPWFAVYSYGSRRFGAGSSVNEDEPKKNVLTKKTVEEKIEDLVKRTKVSDVTARDFNPKIDKLIDAIEDNEVSDSQLDALKKAIQDKQNKKEGAKTLENGER